MRSRSIHSDRTVQGRLKEAGDFGLVQLANQGEGESCARRRISSEYAFPMPLKTTRIGERSLQRVIFTSQCRLKRCKVRSQRLDPTGVELLQGVCSPRTHHMERCTLLSTGFGEQQGAVGKSKAASPILPGIFAAAARQ